MHRSGGEAIAEKESNEKVEILLAVGPDLFLLTSHDREINVVCIQFYYFEFSINPV